MTRAASKLSGRVAVVTGASSGIGEATARAIAAEGARVFAVARRLDRLEALAADASAGPGSVTPLALDLGEDGAAVEAVRRVSEAAGRLDILVNNAGIMLLSDIDGASTSDWRRMLEINVMAVMLATHAALPLFKAQGGGHVVNISSVASRWSRAGAGVYCATKWAVNAFSEALRQEEAKNDIRVTVIEPGLVATELPGKVSNPAVREATEAYYSSIRNLDPADVAEAVLYALCQPEHVGINELLVRPTRQER